MRERVSQYRWIGAVLVAAATALGVTACAVNEKDIDRWTATEHGPEKLYAVVTHGKYSWDLRVEAAMGLVRTKPREGDYVGLRYLIYGYDNGEEQVPGALAVLSPDDRRHIVHDMVPQLVEQMKQRPPPRTDLTLPDGRVISAKCTLPPPDPSVPYKDTAYALIDSNPPLVSDEKDVADLRQALLDWVRTDFDQRIDNVNQQYATETVLRKLGKESVATLPDMVKNDTPKLDRIVNLVSEIGDDATKAKMSASLVGVAKYVESPQWITDRAKALGEVCQRKPDDKLVQAQAQDDQPKQMEQIFGYLNQIGGRPAIEYSLAAAADNKRDEATRKNALAAVKGLVFKDPKDPKNGADADALINIIKDGKAPQAVRLTAATRLSEAIPEQRKAIIPKLYAVFDRAGDNRDLRQAAGLAILQMIDLNQVDDFMRHLPATPDSKMSLTEVIAYGQAITDVVDPKNTIKLDKTKQYLTSNQLGAKLATLGEFFEEKGVDTKLLTPLQDDPQKVPQCADEDKCGWTDPGCWVPKAPGSKESEKKSIATVGDFVRYCILPNVNK